MIEFYTLILKSVYNTIFGLTLTIVIFYGTNGIVETVFFGIEKWIKSFKDKN